MYPFYIIRQKINIEMVENCCYIYRMKVAEKEEISISWKFRGEEVG